MQQATMQPAMMPQAFWLKPFSRENAPQITIAATIQRRPDNQLHLQYDITGEIEAVQWPDPIAHPPRQTELWQQTCLECFVAIPGQSAYWEINLSPSRAWNLYALSDYRSALTESAAYDQLVIQTSRSGSHLSLSLILDLTPLVALETAIALSMTAVIQDQQNHCSYWAIAHVADQPDFHDRASFVVEL